MIASAALLLVVLCSGYYFVNTFLPTKYRSVREVGHRLYFRIALYAILMVLLTSLPMFIVHLASMLTAPEGVSDGISHHLLGRYMRFIETEMGSISMATLPVSVVLSHLLNIVYLNTQWIFARLRNSRAMMRLSGLLYPKKAINMLLEKIFEHRDFEKLVLYALTAEKPLLITLDTGKVYVGLVPWALDPTESREYLKIIPLQSGYRDPDTKKVHFTISYKEMVRDVRSNAGVPNFSSLKSEDFEMIIPSDRIVSAHVFDPDVYQELSQQDL